VKLCNYTDVYNNTFITNDIEPFLMVASCNENEHEKFSLKKDQVAITKDSEKRYDIGLLTFKTQSREYFSVS